MPLFEVPGWDASTSEIKSGPSSSRKRKRAASSGDVEAAVLNFQKLVSKLGHDETDDKIPPASKKVDKRGGGGVQRPQKKKKKELGVQGSPAGVQRVQRDDKKKYEAKLLPVAHVPPSNHDAPQPPPQEKRKKKRNTQESSKPPPERPKPDAGLTALQTKMKSKLDGARFRWINELLYKSDSEQSHQLMSKDPKVFEEYHTGFRHQVQTWPTNPVSHYINNLSSRAKGMVIADFGCGDAALAQALIPKGYCVLSFDLVSDGEFVIEGDICGHLPLPGSEQGNSQVVDIVICALSLMNVNWPDCIKEAWRILKDHGELKIAEVASRVRDVNQFTSLIESIGFQLLSKDEDNTHFSLFEFRKVKRQPLSDWSSIRSKGDILQPCEYKRR